MKDMQFRIYINKSDWDSWHADLEKMTRQTWRRLNFTSWYWELRILITLQTANISSGKLTGICMLLGRFYLINSSSSKDMHEKS
jgi:hypothetical protein